MTRTKISIVPPNLATSHTIATRTDQAEGLATKSEGNEIDLAAEKRPGRDGRQMTVTAETETEIADAIVNTIRTIHVATLIENEVHHGLDRPDAEKSDLQSHSSDPEVHFLRRTMLLRPKEQS
jgi:hypothetical protein